MPNQSLISDISIERPTSLEDLIHCPLRMKYGYADTTFQKAVITRSGFTYDLEAYQRYCRESNPINPIPEGWLRPNLAIDTLVDCVRHGKIIDEELIDPLTQDTLSQPTLVDTNGTSYTESPELLNYYFEEGKCMTAPGTSCTVEQLISNTLLNQALKFHYDKDNPHDPIEAQQSAKSESETTQLSEDETVSAIGLVSPTFAVHQIGRFNLFRSFTLLPAENLIHFQCTPMTRQACVAFAKAVIQSGMCTSSTQIVIDEGQNKVTLKYGQYFSPDAMFYGLVVLEIMTDTQRCALREQFHFDKVADSSAIAQSLDLNLATLSNNRILTKSDRMFLSAVLPGYQAQQRQALIEEKDRRSPGIIG